MKNYLAKTIGLAVAAFLASCTPVEASAVFLSATDEVKFVSDGNPGVYVEYGVGKTYLLWNDESVKNLSNGDDNSGHADTWSLWDEDWGPQTKKIAYAFRKWRELPTEKQLVNIKPAEREKWRKDMFVTANSPKRYPPTKASTTANTPEPLAYSNYRDPDGCTDGRSMVYVKQGGFLGIGAKNVPVGCMTEAEMNRWNIEQQNARRPAYVHADLYLQRTEDLLFERHRVTGVH